MRAVGTPVKAGVTRRVCVMALVSGAVLAGCATRREDLNKAAVRQEIVLEQSLVWKFTAGMNVKIEHEIVPGRYVAELEDRSGTYFFGPGRPIRDMNEWLYPQSRWLEGGIFLPKDHTQPPRFFYVFEALPTSPKQEKQKADYVQTQVTNAIAMPPQGATGLQAGVGTAIGHGLVAGMVQAHYGALEQMRPISEKRIAEAIYQGLRTLQ